MATQAQIATLRHFKWEEFKHPELCYFPFLEWLDEVRHRAGIPFVLTSDARTTVPPGGSPTSLHLVGRAVDFRWNQTNQERAKIVKAVVTAPIPTTEGGFELGLEPTALGGAHWHLGLFPKGREASVFVR